MADIKQGAPPVRAVSKAAPRGAEGGAHGAFGGTPEPPQAVCPSGHKVAEGTVYCTECGVKMGETPRPWTCQHGHSNEAAHRFCAQCGDARPAPNAQSMVTALLNPPRYHAPAGEPVGAIRIHFVEDGFNAFGQIWYLNQELQVMPGTREWAEAQTWIHLTADQQRARWGKVYFHPGPARKVKDPAGTAARRVPGA